MTIILTVKAYQKFYRYKQERDCLVHFVRLANTMLKDGESARNNHVLACKIFTDFNFFHSQTQQ